MEPVQSASRSLRGTPDLHHKQQKGHEVRHDRRGKPVSDPGREGDHFPLGFLVDVELHHVGGGSDQGQVAAQGSAEQKPPPQDGGMGHARELKGLDDRHQRGDGGQVVGKP